MAYFFTSESVSEGHPDKVADQISDALLDNFLIQDPNSKVACETLVTTGLTVLSGEVKTNGYVDVQKVAREVIRRIGYTKSEFNPSGSKKTWCLSLSLNLYTLSSMEGQYLGPIPLMFPENIALREILSLMIL